MVLQPFMCMVKTAPPTEHFPSVMELGLRVGPPISSTAPSNERPSLHPKPPHPMWNSGAKFTVSPETFAGYHSELKPDADADPAPTAMTSNIAANAPMTELLTGFTGDLPLRRLGRLAGPIALGGSVSGDAVHPPYRCDKAGSLNLDTRQALDAVRQRSNEEPVPPNAGPHLSPPRRPSTSGQFDPRPLAGDW